MSTNSGSVHFSIQLLQGPFQCSSVLPQFIFITSIPSLLCQSRPGRWPFRSQPALSGQAGTLSCRVMGLWHSRWFLVTPAIPDSPRLADLASIGGPSYPPSPRYLISPPRVASSLVTLMLSRHSLSQCLLATAWEPYPCHQRSTVIRHSSAGQVMSLTGYHENWHTPDPHGATGTDGTLSAITVLLLVSRPKGRPTQFWRLLADPSLTTFTG